MVLKSKRLLAGMLAACTILMSVDSALAASSPAEKPTTSKAETTKNVTADSGEKMDTKKDGTCAYKKTSAKKAKKAKITVPATLKRKGVTYRVVQVNKKAFKNAKKLTQVTLGKNVVLVKKKAFLKRRKLKTVIIKSKKYVKFEDGAFTGCGFVLGTSRKLTIKVPKSWKKKDITKLKKTLKKNRVNAKVVKS